jgi:glycosyltransferase involved in cell wall biosynthesis
MNPETASLVFLLPCLNEELGIADTIQAIRKIPARMPVRIVVVDGGSHDKSVAVARENGAEVLVTGKGYGRQYIFGFAQIQCDYLISGDSDGTYPFAEAYGFLEKYLLNGDYEFVSTNRFGSLTPGTMGYARQFANWFLTSWTNILFGLHIRDSQSGMWIFRFGCLRKMKLADGDMAFSEEIKIEAFTKLKAIEVPITYGFRVGTSKVNIKHGIKNTWFLFKKRFF